ncbi:MAG: response regulator [Emcibacter sp.]|nr:response regulator [Emcibacter sp.]
MSTSHGPDSPAEKYSPDLVYLAESDLPLAVEITAILEKTGYDIRNFTDTDKLYAACGEQLPAAIIMEATETGLITGLKSSLPSCPPIILLIEQDNMANRLAALRAGANRIFHKPLDMESLLHTLNSLTERKATRTYRILLIDDDKVSLKYYGAILQKAGMEIETLSNPLEGLQRLAEFKPDVLVTDVHMPDCSGPELAQVIRLDDSWAMMPIIFLSSESDLNRQLSAIDQGGDSFLKKPVDPNHLISTVTAKAKRARWADRLNTDLKSALRESKFQLTTMDEHDIVSIADVTGRITSVNDKFCVISGYKRSELIGKNHRILKSDRHPPEFYQDLWQTISSGKIWSGTVCNRKKDGSEYWVKSTIVPFLNDKGKPYKYVSARTNVTRLRKSEERLNRSQSFANIGNWDWDISTGDLYWSDNIWQLFGYEKKPPQTTYENFLDAIHPEDRGIVVSAIYNCVHHGTEYNIEHRVLWPDGSSHWVHESGDVVRDSNGKPMNMMGVVQDVDTRKRAELALAERERQLHEAQALANIGNWQINLTTDERTWSDEVYRIGGLEPGSIVPNADFFYSIVHPDDLERVRKNVERTEKTGHQDIIYRILMPDETVRHVHDLAKGDMDTEGNMIMLSGTLQDITERVEAEQKLLLAREEAEKANRAKSQFLSGMSHELRTPMNAIMGFGQLLKMETEQPLNESQQENVDEIIKASHHLLDLINEVLDLTRIEAGHIDLSIEVIAYAEVIADARQLITPLAQKRGITITATHNDIPVTFEQLVEKRGALRADRIRLKQILLNLLSNAVKYNRENGKIIIGCDTTKDKITRITITDTGAGLDADQQAQLFNSFVRLEKGKSGVEGTGIGLVITKNLVELMGGTIGVESRPNKGSHFWIELPSDNLLPVQKNIPARKSPALSPPKTALQHQHTVLYIEDNPGNLRLVSQLLEQRPNIHMWSAQEPLLGLDLAAEHKPDLILLDINLPGMSGFEVLKHLQKHEATCHTPVIAISANAMPHDIKKGFDAGFDDYITKPIDVHALLQAIEKKLQGKATRAIKV